MREDDRQVVVGGALGDVRVRQPRDDAARPRGTGRRPRSFSTAAIRFWCVSWTPFGGPVVPRRVDQRQQVVGLLSARQCGSGSKSGSEPSTSSQATVPSPCAPSRTTTVSSSGRPSSRAPVDLLEVALLDQRDLRAGVLRRRTGSARARASRRARTAWRRASSPRGRRCGTRGGWRTSARRCRPCLTPSLARPPASASTRSRSSRPGQRDLVVLGAHGDACRGAPRRSGGTPPPSWRRRRPDGRARRCCSPCCSSPRAGTTLRTILTQASPRIARSPGPARRVRGRS